MLTQEKTPLLFPVTISCPAGQRTLISFPQRFQGKAVSISIQNESGAGAATYRYNGESNPLKNCPASSFRTIDYTKVWLLEVNADAGAVTIVEAQVLPLSESNL